MRASIICLALPIALGCGRSLELPDTSAVDTVRILTFDLPDGRVDTIYNATIQSSGPGSKSWTLVEGTLPPGLALRPEGDFARIEGRPVTTGAFAFRIRVVGDKGQQDAVDYTIDVDSDEPLNIVTESLPAGLQNQTYRAQIEARGGSGERFWTIYQGVLNDGLTITPVGNNVEVRGVPTLAGPSTFGVRVQDSAGVVAERSFTIVIQGDGLPLRIIPSDLPIGIMRENYVAPIVGEGGVVPYRWTVVDGSLPPGVSLDIDGTPSTRLNGRPIRAGDYAFTVELIDGDGTLARQDFFVTILDATPLEILTQRLPDGVVTQTYVGSVEATPGLGPYVWNVTGAFPRGMRFAPSDQNRIELRGVPLEDGAFSLNFTVEDASGRTASRTLTLRVTLENPVLEITTTSIPTAPIGTPYEAMIEATGGVPPYRWTVAGGLPSGMIMDANGTPSTRLTGTPGQSGTFMFVVTVRDSNGSTADRSLNFVVTAGDPLQIVTTSVEAAAPCTEYDAPIEATGGSMTGYTWSISQGTLPPGLTLSASGTPRTAIRGVPAASGNFPIGVTVVDSNMNSETRAYVVQVGTTSGPRFALFSGTMPNSNSVGRLHAIDLCTPTPTALGAINSPGPGEIGVQRHSGALAIAPTGDRAAYSGQQGNFGVFVVDLRGPMPTQSPVLPGFTGRRSAVPIWSPDGQKLAFRVDGEVQGRFDLYVVDVRDPANPGPMRRVNAIDVPNGDVLNSIEWSPDSSRIAFIGDLEMDNLLELYVADVYTSSVSVRAVSGSLSGTQDILNFPPVWNAQSNGLIVAGQLNGSRRQPFWVDLTVGAPAAVALSTSVPTFATLIRYYPSPDRRWLAYISDEILANTFDLFLVDLNAPLAAPRKINANIPAGRRVSHVEWNSISNALIYSANIASTSRGAIFRVRTAVGGAATRLDQTPMNGGGVNLSNTAFRWTPNDDGVVYLIDATTAFRFEPFFVDFSNGPPSTPVIVGQHTARSNTRVMKFARDVNRLFLVVEPPNSGPRELFVADLTNGGPGTTTRLTVAGQSQSVPTNAQLLAPRPRGTRVFFALGSSFSASGRPFVSSLIGPPPTAPLPMAAPDLLANLLLHP